MRDAKKRMAFGLVDLVTALCCMAVLASLTFPCLIQLRSAARLDRCKKRITDICLTAHRFHENYKRLPVATIGAGIAVDANVWAKDETSPVFWKNLQQTSSLAIMGRYFESETIQDNYLQLPPICYDMYSDFTEYVDANDNRIYEWIGSTNAASDVIQKDVPEFLCPEDDLADTRLPGIIATQPCLPSEKTDTKSIDECRDIATMVWPRDDDETGFTNYLACLGATGLSWKQADTEWSRWRGAMSPRAKLTLPVINRQDGTSQTIMYGESVGEIVDHERKSAMTWLLGGGARATGNLPFDQDQHPTAMAAKRLGDSTYSSAVGFGSKHENAVVFAFCDGSCHAIKSQIDRRVLHELSAAFDGGDPVDF